MDNFISYYWNINDVKSELRASLEKLLAGNQISEEKSEAFFRLLNSNDSVAQGIIFDQFFYTDSLNRFGITNFFERFGQLLLEKARKQLQSSPIETVASNGRKIVGANYASALGIIARLGTKDDISLVTSILNTSKDAEVLYNACLAVGHCLADTSEVVNETITALKQIIYDVSLSTNLRISAVRAFADYEVPEAEELLRKVSRECDPSISIYSAYTLAGSSFERNKDFLKQVSDDWGTDVGYPGSEILKMLRDDSVNSDKE